jgi:hypothetical protein
MVTGLRGPNPATADAFSDANLREQVRQEPWKLLN